MGFGGSVKRTSRMAQMGRRRTASRPVEKFLELVGDATASGFRRGAKVAPGSCMQAWRAYCPVCLDYTQDMTLHVGEFMVGEPSAHEFYIYCENKCTFEAILKGAKAPQWVREHAHDAGELKIDHASD